jgi:hypothetical protein
MIVIASVLRSNPMPLNLDNRHVLPDGLHDATVEEVRAVFGDLSTRYELFERLKKYLVELQRTGWPCTVIIDGSFVMASVPDPEDVDLVLGYPADVQSKIEDDTLIPYQLNLLDKRHCQREYRIDLKPCVVDSDKFESWITFFSQVSMKRADVHGLPPNSTKGLVRIRL